MNPSRAQYRMLHVLSQGKLTFQRWPTRRFAIAGGTGEKAKGETDESWQFHEVTARTIVDRGWAELRKFNSQRGEYGITITGLALANELCDCRHRRTRLRGRSMPMPPDRKVNFFEEETEILAGRMLCKNCGRWVRCVSRKTEPHGATRWHLVYGPVCDSHPR